MNSGELKHFIRTTIFPTDNITELKRFLSCLSQIDRNMLINTTLKYDAIECFKLLYHGYWPVSDMMKYAPPKICLYLKNDEKLRCLLFQKRSSDRSLGEYFCKVLTPEKDLIHHFRVARNFIPYVFMTLNVDGVFQSVDKNVYESVWSFMTHAQRLQVDPERIAKEDWKELMDFPWQGFIKIHTYPLHDILLYAYPENVWLNKWNAPFIICHIQKNMKKWMEYKWLEKFPWDIFNKHVTPPSILYDIFQLAEIDNRYLKTRFQTVNIIEKYQNE